MLSSFNKYDYTCSLSFISVLSILWSITAMVWRKQEKVNHRILSQFIYALKKQKTLSKETSLIRENSAFARKKQILNYWRKRSSSLTSIGKKRALLTQMATFFSLCVGKETTLHFYHQPGVLLRGQSLICFHKNALFSSIPYLFQAFFLGGPLIIIP